MAEPEFTTEELESEEWRPVVGYEAIYSISNLGRVRRDKTATSTKAGRILRPSLAGSGYVRGEGFREGCGYWYITLRDTGRKLQVSVHVLVAATFLGPCPDGQEVNHIDGNKRNPRLSNLEYLTHQKNKDHAKANLLTNSGDKHGSHTRPERRPTGERNGQAKVNEFDVLEIRTKYAAGDTSYAKLGKEYLLSAGGVRLIVKRRNWKHVT